MSQITKKNLIKDFILLDDERFSIALDIYENFEEITNDVIKFITIKLIEYINDKNKLSLKVISVVQQANDYFYIVDINEDYYLQFYSSYFFKTYVMHVVLREGFDKNNKKHIDLQKSLLDALQKKYENIATLWSIVQFNNKKYEMNMGNTYIDLYKVYKDEGLLSNLRKNYNEIFGEVISEVISTLGHYK